MPSLYKTVSQSHRINREIEKHICVCLTYPEAITTYRATYQLNSAVHFKRYPINRNSNKPSLTTHKSVIILPVVCVRFLVAKHALYDHRLMSTTAALKETPFPSQKNTLS